MKIGIIGTGQIGRTLAQKLSAAGHEVKVANSRGPQSIGADVLSSGAFAVTAEVAAANVDVLIVSIPFSSMPHVERFVQAAAADTVIIDTSNYYPMRDGKIAEVEMGKAESVWSSEQLGRPVIKAFNAVLANTLAENGAPVGTEGRLAIPVAGDDEHAKAIAASLVNDAGFDPVDAGSLADSWRQQPGTPAYCTELAAAELRAALDSAVKGRGPANRDALMNEFMAAETFPSHDAVIQRNREVTVTR